MIPVADPRAENLALRTEIEAAFRRVVESGTYILGAEVEAFEREFASFVGARHGVGVGNGTDALHVALRALGIGAGDEVVTVSHTAVATATAIRQAGARPVFVDIDPVTFTLDAAGLPAALTPRTKAVVPVHLYGRPAEMGPILEFAAQHDLRVVEDCAQAHGSRYQGNPVGSLGDAACFSFYPTKNLGALGDGGIVVTRDGGVTERARLLRQYGWSQRYVSSSEGWNTRLDELQAAVLRVKLPHLEERNAARRRLAARYRHLLEGLPLATPPEEPGVQHAHHLYVVRSAARDALGDGLRRAGISTAVHYPVPVHLQPAFADLARTGLPETERAAREVLTLPLHPLMEPSTVDAVAGAARTVLSASGRTITSRK